MRLRHVARWYKQSAACHKMVQTECGMSQGGANRVRHVTRWCKLSEACHKVAQNEGCGMSQGGAN
jgi:hypothetical protein